MTTSISSEEQKIKICLEEKHNNKVTIVVDEIKSDGSSEIISEAYLILQYYLPLCLHLNNL